MRKLLISLLILSYVGSVCAGITSIRKGQLILKTQTAPLGQVKPVATMMNGNIVAKTPFIAKKK